MSPEFRRPVESEVTDEQIQAIEDYFFNQAAAEYPLLATRNEGGIAHFQNKATLEAREAGQLSLAEVDAIGATLIPNFDRSAIEENYQNSPFQRERLLRQLPTVEQFNPQAEVLRAAREYGPVVFLGNHPTVATPAYNLRSSIEVFGEESIDDTYTVIGPFPVTMKFGHINPLELLSSMSHVQMTGPSASRAKQNKTEIRDGMSTFARRFKEDFNGLIEAEPDEDEEFPVIHIMSGGTRDKQFMKGSPHKRAVNPGMNPASAQLIVHPGVSYAVVGTDDRLFDAGIDGDFRSNVHRKMRIYRVEENPEPVHRRVGHDLDFLVFDMENDESDPIQLSRSGTLRFLEKRSVDLANAAAIEAGSKSKYYFGGSWKKTKS